MGFVANLVAHALSVNIMTILLYEARARNANLKFLLSIKRFHVNNIAFGIKRIFGGIF